MADDDYWEEYYEARDRQAETFQKVVKGYLFDHEADLLNWSSDGSRRDRLVVDVVGLVQVIEGRVRAALADVDRYLGLLEESAARGARDRAAENYADAREIVARVVSELDEWREG